MPRRFPQLSSFSGNRRCLKNAHSLLTLQVQLPRDSRHLDPSGIVTLANALGHHTALQQEFAWLAPPLSRQGAHHDTIIDPVLRALAACPNLRKVAIMTNCASANAARNLLHSPTVRTLHLVMNTEYWLAVANEIQHGRNNIRDLVLAMVDGTSSNATKAVKAIASMIQRDHNMESLDL
jgi:hypothetical protein